MPLAKNVMGAHIAAAKARALNGNNVNAAVTAAGTTQSDATAITADVNVITTGTTGQGVLLYSGVPGDDQIVYNGTTADLRVYPPTGENVNQLAANSGFVLASYTGVMVKKVSSTQWLGFLSA